MISLTIPPDADCGAPGVEDDDPSLRGSRRATRTPTGVGAVALPGKQNGGRPDGRPPVGVCLDGREAGGVGDTAHLWNTRAQLQYLQHVAANLPGPDAPPAEPEPRQTPKAARRLKDHKIKELVAAYEAGSTLRQLAERFRIERRTVSNVLKRHGVPTRWRRLTEADIDKAEHLYGWSSARIADLFKVDPETVRLRLRRRGVQMRDPHQRG